MLLSLLVSLNKIKKVFLEWSVRRRWFLCWVFLLSLKTHQDGLIIVKQCALETDRLERATDSAALQFSTFKQGW